jgi:cellulose synthase/poly-beta-1,6-N-acetylglucosamine synthase-like glycosyltransferase
VALSVLLAFVDALGFAAAAILLVLASHHLHLARRAANVPPGTPAPAIGKGSEPSVVVQLPVYNELRSVAGALDAAAALDWPRDRLTVQLLDDSDDETSALAAIEVARLRRAGTEIEHVRRSARTGFKAGALAAGLARSRAEFVAMIDADFRPHPSWLRLGIGRLTAEPDAAFVQFRFEFANRNANWMTRAQQLTVDAHFLMEQAGRLAGGGPMQFNGTAGIWRRAAIDAAGGWEADTLAEDLDIAIRAFAAGWTASLVLDPAVEAEAPETLGVWRVQQRRWSRGFGQVAAKALGLVWEPGVPSRLRWGTTLLLGLQLGLPAILVVAAAFLSDGLLRGGFGWGHLSLAAGGILLGTAFAVAITWPAYRRLRRGGLIRYATTLASLPPLYLFLAAVNSIAILTAPLADEQEFVRTPKSGR